jgi:hypothetical protein
MKQGVPLLHNLSFATPLRQQMLAAGLVQQVRDEMR